MFNQAGYRQMKRLYESHGHEYLAELSGCIRSGELKWSDIGSLRSLAEALVPNGAEWVRMLNPANSLNFREAAAVDTKALGIIASNLVYSRIRESYNRPEFVLSRLAPTITGKPGEIEPSFVDLGDDASIVPEGQEYPSATIGSDHIIRPQTQKEGTIVPVTREAIYEDRTNQVMSHAGRVGETLALRKEYRLIDTLIGYSRQVGGYGNLFNWRGTEYAPYQAATPWINTVDSNDLVDHTDLDVIEQLFANMSDPNTGLPIALSGTTVLVCPAKRQAASTIINATEINYGTPVGTDTTSIRKSANPVSAYALETSVHLYRRLQLGGNAGATVTAGNAGKYYFVGDFPRAICWYEQFALKVETSGMDSEVAFMRDIVMRFKASHKGGGSWNDPRYMVRSRDAA